jgi:hypothetical protein
MCCRVEPRARMGAGGRWPDRAITRIAPTLGKTLFPSRIAPPMRRVVPNPLSLVPNHPPAGPPQGGPLGALLRLPLSEAPRAQRGADPLPIDGLPGPAVSLSLKGSAGGASGCTIALARAHPRSPLHRSSSTSPNPVSPIPNPCVLPASSFHRSEPA